MRSNLSEALSMQLSIKQNQKGQFVFLLQIFIVKRPDHFGTLLPTSNIQTKKLRGRHAEFFLKMGPWFLGGEHKW